MSKPLGEVLSRARGDFVPARPGRKPWVQPSGEPIEIAYTGITHIVPLSVADRVHLIGVGWPSTWQDDLEPGDWMPVTWGAGTSVIVQ